jgi:hypothetical protein
MPHATGPSDTGAWLPSPSKRTLNERLNNYGYLMGHMRYASVFCDTLDLATPNRAALLGFGDLCNAWATAGAAVASRCPRLELDLVDFQVANVARGALLDFLTTEALDVETSQEDALFLWGVTYCAALPPPWLPRLRDLIGRLLGEGFEARFGSKNAADAARRALLVWADPRGPPPLEEIQKQRWRNLKLWYLSKRRQAILAGGPILPENPTWDDVLGALTMQVVLGMEGLDRHVLQSECRAYLKTGSAYPVTAAQLSSAPESKWAVNPTLLEPGTWGWNLRYDRSPFRRYMPLVKRESRR